jgi:hypothetical protein
VLNFLSPFPHTAFLQVLPRAKPKWTNAREPLRPASRTQSRVERGDEWIIKAKGKTQQVCNFDSFTRLCAPISVFCELEGICSLALWPWELTTSPGLLLLSQPVQSLEESLRSLPVSSDAWDSGNQLNTFTC